MRKRWVRVVVASVLILIVGGIVFKVVVLNPPLSQHKIQALPKEIPEEWLKESPHEASTGEQKTAADPVEPSPIVEEPVEEQRTALPKESVTTGSLVFEVEGKRLGEESYLLRISEKEGIQLTSTGSFSFKVLFAKLKVVYVQEINLGFDLRPISFRLDMNGPLGFGDQKIAIGIEGDTAFISAGEEEWEQSIDTDNAMLLGTFSSYALIPKLLEARSDGSSATFQVLASRGVGEVDEKEDEGTSKTPSTVSSIEIERTGTVTIRAGSTEIVVDRYLLKGKNGESILLAKDGELIGLIGDEPDRSFIVYREDFFSQGFEMVAQEKE